MAREAPLRASLLALALLGAVGCARPLHGTTRPAYDAHALSLATRAPAAQHGVAMSGAPFILPKVTLPWSFSLGATGAYFPATGLAAGGTLSADYRLALTDGHAPFLGVALGTAPDGYVFGGDATVGWSYLGRCFEVSAGLQLGVRATSQSAFISALAFAPVLGARLRVAWMICPWFGLAVDVVPEYFFALPEPLAITGTVSLVFRAEPPGDERVADGPRR